MSILVFGKTGQLARELDRWDETLCLERDVADFCDPAAVVAQVEATKAKAVIIAAAYTGVDKAEEEQALALQINAETPGAIARACAARRLPVIYVSTDYVFDGQGSAAWQPDSVTAPINAYGQSKLAGEVAVRAAGGVYGILRTSWVVSCHGQNFVKTMLRLGAERDRLTVINDQIGAPTPARDLARTCVAMARQLCSAPEQSGTYHLQGAPLVSWAGFAREIFTQAGIDCAVEDIATTDYPTPAARPLNSRLDCSTLETVFGIAQPDWTQSLADILKDLREAS